MDDFLSLDALQLFTRDIPLIYGAPHLMSSPYKSVCALHRPLLYLPARKYLTSRFTRVHGTFFSWNRPRVGPISRIAGSSSTTMYTLHGKLRPTRIPFPGKQRGIYASSGGTPLVRFTPVPFFFEINSKYFRWNDFKQPSARARARAQNRP